jgi:hypothetical protein
MTRLYHARLAVPNDGGGPLAAGTRMMAMPDPPPPAPLPAVVAHADWGCDPRKRQVATAVLAPEAAPAHYRVVSLAAAPGGAAGRPDLFAALAGLAALAGRPGTGTVLIGFDFTIGLPRAYAAAVGAESFPAFLGRLGSPPWQDFDRVAERPEQISLGRPFYPYRPGGTRREHLYAGLGLRAAQLRRRCDGTDAETLFWTLGGKQAGKASLHGWRLLRQARADGTDLALWPFDGGLPALLAAGRQVTVAETYPREFYRCIGAPPRGRWSKRRQADRLECVPALLAWADSLAVGWDEGIRRRAEGGFSAGPTGEDEFDAVVGMLGLISVVTGARPAGVPPDDPAVLAVEGWILGRPATPGAVNRRSRSLAQR